MEVASRKPRRLYIAAQYRLSQRTITPVLLKKRASSKNGAISRLGDRPRKCKAAFA